MHTFARLALASLIAAPTFGQAACYEVISSTNQVVYRSRLAPIDLSKPISQGMAGRFPSGHTMVFSPDESACREVAMEGSAMTSAQGNALQDGSGYSGRSTLASGRSDLSTTLPPTAAGRRVLPQAKPAPAFKTER